MDFKHLKTFVTAAQLQSFSKAAQALGYTQAAITIQIQQLEEELQTHLFERFPRHVSLTAQGNYFCSMPMKSCKQKMLPATP